MVKNNNIKSILSLLLILTMIVQVFIPFTDINKVYAKNGDQIVQSLEIVGGKKEEYRPGDIVNVKGNWLLPDDNAQTEYKAGDSFSIKIPDGLSPAFGTIKLGDMAEGRVVGDKVVFTFNENIEQLMDRKGGFNLIFTVDTPSEEGEKDLPIDFKDENNNSILKDNIKVNHVVGEVVGESQETFAKGAYGHTTGDEIQWYIRVNQDGELTEKGKVKIHDTVLGENHQLVPGKFKILKQDVGVNSSGHDFEVDVSISDDLKSFDIELDLSGNYWYTIFYYTEYIGDYKEDVASEDYDNGILTLKNKVELITDKGETYYPDNTTEGNISTGNFNLGGWAEGKSGYAKLTIKKIDAITKETLPGATFEIVNMKNQNEVLTVTTGADGTAKVTNNGEWLNGGRYVIKEVKSPEGYKLNQEEYNIDIGNNEIKEIEIKNIPEPIEIKVEKEWLNHKGDVIKPEQDIAVKLFANGKAIRQGVIKQGISLTFKNLQKVDKSGEEIKYIVEEIVPEGYEKDPIVKGNSKEGFTIVNKKLKPKGSFILSKVDAENNNIYLQGAKFKLTKDNDEDFVAIEKPTNNEGQIVFKDLNPGVYSLEEVEAPKGYLLSDEPIKLEISKDGKVFKLNNKKLVDFLSSREEVDSLLFPNIQETKVSVEKKWDGKVLDKVKVRLLGNDKLVSEVELSDSNNWKHTFEKLPKTDLNGKIINYKVDELKTANYQSKIESIKDNDFIITNTFIPEKTYIEVKKEWQGKVLDKVEVILLKNGKKIDEFTLGKSNNWTKRFDDLDKTDKNGILNKYEVKEIVPEGYDSEVIGNSEKGFTIINKEKEPELIDIKVTKVWEGDYNKDTNIIVNLYKVEDGELKPYFIDNQQVKINLNSKNNWSSSFKELPKYYQKTGKEIQYTVREVELEGYDSKIEGSAETGFTVTNTKQEKPVEVEPIDIEVTKIWKGLDGTEKLDEVTIELLADNKLVESVKLNSSNEWKYKFTNLSKKDKDGKDISYTVKEVELEGYDSKIEGSAETGFTVTNTKQEKPVEVEPIDIEVTKIWKGLDGTEKLDEVTIELLADNKLVESVKLNSSNEWKYKFTNLSKKDKDGKDISYTVKEVELEGYDSKIEGSAETGFTVINTKEEPETPKPVEPEKPKADLVIRKVDSKDNARGLKGAIFVLKKLIFGEDDNVAGDEEPVEDDAVTGDEEPVEDDDVAGDEEPVEDDDVAGDEESLEDDAETEAEEAAEDGTETEAEEQVEDGDVTEDGKPVEHDSSSSNKDYEKIEDTLNNLDFDISEKIALLVKEGDITNILESKYEDLGKYTSDIDGYITLDDLEEGIYILRETSSPDGYQLESKDIKIIVKKDESGEFTFEVKGARLEGGNQLIVENEKLEEPETPEPEEPEEPEKPEPEEPKKPTRPSRPSRKPKDPKPEEPKEEEPEKPIDETPEEPEEEPKEDEIVEIEEETPLGTPEPEESNEKEDEEDELPLSAFRPNEKEDEEDELPLSAFRPNEKEDEEDELPLSAFRPNEKGPISQLPKTGETRIFYNLIGILLLGLGFFIRRKSK